MFARDAWTGICRATRMSGTPSRLSPQWIAVLAGVFAATATAAFFLASPLRGWLGVPAIIASDRGAWELLHGHVAPALLAVAALVNALHGTAGILVLTAAAAGAWAWRGAADACLRVLVAVPVGMLLNMLVKLAVHRGRPDWAVVVLPLSYSFPSGHVAEATVFYGSLCLEATVRGVRRSRQRLAALGAITMIAVVACSRIIVGAHFLSDCIAAVLEGSLWLAACFSRPPLKPAPARVGAR